MDYWNSKKRVGFKAPSFLEGFTIIELLMTIGLVFLFAILTLPIGIDFYKNQMVRDLTKELESSLRNVQAAALTNRGDSNAGIKIKSGEYIIFEGNSYQGRRPALDIIRPYPGGVEISGLSEVVFQKETGLPIFPGLAGHWQLNNTGGTTIYDYSLYGNLNHGEVLGPFSWVTGREKKALELQGGQIVIPHHSSLNPKDSITLFLWINISEVEPGTLLLIKKGSPRGSPPTGYQLAIDGTNNLFLFEIGDGQNTQTISNQFEPAEIINKWINLVAVWDGELMSQYLNGEKLSQTQEFNQQIEASNDDLIIAENFTGKIDDIRIYDLALSEKDIEANYSSKKDDLIISLKFHGQREEIVINHQGKISR
jgi:type II secretory pathway pseudopilin PulG